MATKKLFEVITVEPEKRSAFEKIKNETVHVFKGKDLFEGHDKQYTPKNEGGDPLEGQKKEVVTTVEQRLAWTEKTICDFIDLELVKENSNMRAKADIVIDGVVLAKEVPATFLLPLEKRLKEIRDYYDQIPTRELSKKWEETGSGGILKHGPIEQYRTAKKTIPIVLYPATDKHPAQVKDVTEDVHIGTWRTTYFSGAAHPGQKAEWIGRIDKLIEAVKKARMKANEVETTDASIGKTLFDFIHGRNK